MVSKSFDINTTGLQPFDPATRRLIIELAPESVAVILWNRDKTIPEAVEIFKGSHAAIEDWEAMLQQSRLLGFTDLETLVVIAYPEMIPVPAPLYTPESAKAQLELFFGWMPAIYTSGDVLQEDNMVISWQMPLVVHEFLSGHFSVLQIRHLASVAIESHEAITPFDGQIILYGNLGWAVLWVDCKLQIIKPVSFSKPDDLSWHLLNICKQFDLTPTSVSWQVSGMAENSSPLWLAVTRFLDPVVAMNAGIPLQEELPGHYFAHLFVALRH